MVDYSIEKIPETTVLVNPKYRSLDTDVRRTVGILNSCRAKCCAIALTGEIEPKKVEEYQQKKGELQEDISHLEREAEQLKQERKATKKHLTIAELPEAERFSRLSTKSKYLMTP